MVGDDVEQLGCRHREQAVVRGRAAERCPRLGHRRLQEAEITKASIAAEAYELALVEREDDFDREKLDLDFDVVPDGGRFIAHLASFR